MFGKTKSNLWLDITIFIAFLVTAITGLLFWLIFPEGQGSRLFVFMGLTKEMWTTIHNWAGVTMLAGALIHILLHWKWITSVAKRYFKRLAKQARLNFSLDFFLLIAFILVNLSGLVAWLAIGQGGYQGGRNPRFNATAMGLSRHEWNDIHLYSSLAIIVILISHIIIHWKWIIFMLRRYTNQAIERFDLGKSQKAFPV